MTFVRKGKCYRALLLSEQIAGQKPSNCRLQLIFRHSWLVKDRAAARDYVFGNIHCRGSTHCYALEMLETSSTMLRLSLVSLMRINALASARPSWLPKNCSK